MRECLIEAESLRFLMSEFSCLSGPFGTAAAVVNTLVMNLYECPASPKELHSILCSKPGSFLGGGHNRCLVKHIFYDDGVFVQTHQSNNHRTKWSYGTLVKSHKSYFIFLVFCCYMSAIIVRMAALYPMTTCLSFVIHLSFEKSHIVLPLQLVPEGYAFVLGDNQNNSFDSHNWLGDRFL